MTVKFWSAQKLPSTDADKAARIVINELQSVLAEISDKAVSSIKGNPSDSKVLAVTLLLRTNDMLTAVLLLMDSHLYIEAGTIREAF